MMRPRILFVSPRIPHPRNSGTKIRIANLLQAMSDVGDVDFVGFGNQRELDSALDTSPRGEQWWKNLRSAQLLREPEWHGTNPRRFRAAIHSRPFTRTGLFYSSFDCHRLHGLASPLASAADLIWVERLYIARPFSRFAHKVIVDLDDLESIKLSRMAASECNPYTRWAMNREAGRLARMEKAAIGEFARVAVCSNEDTRFFGSEGQRAWIVPNGVADALMSVPAVPRAPAHLVFVGTLHYRPNEDAAHHFCRDIFPRILARHPNAKLSIVGLAPSASILALQDNIRVFVHGNVPDVAPFVQNATLSIVPLRSGGGTRLKILESLALNTPVVSTRIGAEGLALNDGEHLLLADTPDEFATAVIRLLEDQPLHAQLSIRGRERVRDVYLWSSIRDQLAERCNEFLIATRKRAT